MTNRSLITGIAVAAITAFGLVPALSQDLWNMPTPYVPDNPHTQNIGQFAEDVAEATDGKLQIRVFPNGSLFKGSDIKRVVSTGQAQIGEVLMALHENENPIWGLDSVPFVATSFDEAEKLWAAQKPAIAEILAEQGLIPLFAVPWGPNGIFSNKPIEKPEDVEGMKWRVYNYGTARIGEILGAQPVSIAAAELPQALATGMIDAFMVAGQAGYDYKVWDAISHFYNVAAWVPKNITVMNQDAFNALDEETQEALLAAAKEAEIRGWEMWREKDAWYLNQLSERGMIIAQPTDEVAAKFNAIGRTLRSEWLEKAGEEGAEVLEDYQNK